VIREKPRNCGSAGACQVTIPIALVGCGGRGTGAATQALSTRGPTWLVAMAAESGKMVTWDEALHSNIELAPRLDKLTMQSPPPVKPDATGHYPIAMPGFTTTV